MLLARFKRSNSRGDTIVEVMVVLAVLGLAIGISYATANRSLLNTRQAEENSQATELVQSQIEGLRSLAQTTASDTGIFAPNAGLPANPNPTQYGLFCLQNGTIINPSTTQEANYATNFSSGSYPSACTQTGPPYHLAVAYCGGSNEDRAVTPLCNNSTSTFVAQATWPDVDGQGNDTVTLFYKLYPETPLPLSPPPGSPSTPSVTLTANPTTVTSGQISTLTWTLAGSFTSCTSSDSDGSSWFNEDGVPTSGSTTVTSPTVTKTQSITYGLTCTDSSGKQYAAPPVAVKVNPPFSVTLSNPVCSPRLIFLGLIGSYSANVAITGPPGDTVTLTASGSSNVDPAAPNPQSFTIGPDGTVSGYVSGSYSNFSLQAVHISLTGTDTSSGQSSTEQVC